MATSTKRRWLPIAAGIAVLVVFLGIGAIAISVAWFSEHTTVERDVASTAAAAAFDQAKRRFADVRPVVEFGDEPQAALRRGHRDAEQPGHRDHGPRAGLGSRRTRPGHRGPADVAAAPEVGPDRVRRPTSTASTITGCAWTVEDMERYGPGVLFDFTAASGERVLLSAQ